MRQNAFAAGARLRTPPGELTALPQTLEPDLGKGEWKGLEMEGE